MAKPRARYQPTREFTIEHDGFYGVYYEPEHNQFPGKAMVVCTGSDGSFLLCRLGAEKFYEAGMPVIALGYWNVPGTSKDDCLIPVEYMQNACQWFIREKGLQPGVWGISLGGTYVLLCGSLFPEIRCVVAVSPAHYLFQPGTFSGGLRFTSEPPFTWGGKPLPHIGLTAAEREAYTKQAKRNLLLKREPDLLFCFAHLLERPHDPAAEIAVEKIQAPILLLSGGQDVMLPANANCQAAMERLRANNFAYPFVHHNYEVLSHYVCPLRPMTSSMFRVERKHKAECNENRRKSWEDTLVFLRDEWKL